MIRLRLPGPLRALRRDLRAVWALNRCIAINSRAHWEPFGFELWLTAPNERLSGYTPLDTILSGRPWAAVAEARRVVG